RLFAALFRVLQGGACGAQFPLRLLLALSCRLMVRLLRCILRNAVVRLAVQRRQTLAHLCLCRARILQTRHETVPAAASRSLSLFDATHRRFGLVQRLPLLSAAVTC